MLRHRKYIDAKIPLTWPVGVLLSDYYHFVKGKAAVQGSSIYCLFEMAREEVILVHSIG